MVVIIAAVVWLPELNSSRKAPRYYDADAPFTAPDRSAGARTWNQRFYPPRGPIWCLGRNSSRAVGLVIHEETIDATWFDPLVAYWK